MGALSWRRLILYVFIVTAVVLVIRFSKVENDNYEALQQQPHAQNSLPMSLAKSSYKPRAFKQNSRNAVVSILTGDKYVLGLQVLGKSLRESHTRCDLVVAYVPEFVSIRALCLLESAGWTVRPVERLLPPRIPFRKIRDTFYWMFTKLRLWSWTEYDSLLLVDSDTLILKNLDDIFQYDIDFGAALDIWEWKFDNVVNGGVLLLKPNQQVYKDMLNEMEAWKLRYDFGMAEQGFLGYKFKYNSFKLPFVYNVNLALRAHPLEWELVWSDARLIHFTMTKPFLDQRSETGPYSQALEAWWHQYDLLKSNSSEFGVNCPATLPVR